MYIIFSKPNCGQCVQSKNMLRSKGLEYNEVHMDVGQPKEIGAEYISRDDLLAKCPGAKTMPQIFKDDTYIGGFAEFVAHLKGI